MAKTQEEYLKQPGECPFCGSNDIEGDSMDMDGMSAWQNITCRTCYKQYTDVYKLVGYEVD